MFLIEFLVKSYISVPNFIEIGSRADEFQQKTVLTAYFAFSALENAKYAVKTLSLLKLISLSANFNENLYTNVTFDDESNKQH